MQGTSISEYPHPPRQGSSAGKIFAALVVLSVVGVLGVVAGVVFSRNNMPPPVAGAAQPTPIPVQPVTSTTGATATAAATGSTTGVPPIVDPNGHNGVLGASAPNSGDAGASSAAATGSSTKAGGKKGGKGKTAGGGQKSESGDEYGF